MSYHRLLLILLLCTGSIFNLTAQDLEQGLEPFHLLRVAGPYEVTLVPGTDNSISISGSEEWIDRVKIEERGGKLSLTLSNKFDFRRSEMMRVTITYTETLHELVVTTGAELESDEVIVSKDLEITASAGGIADLEVQTTWLRLRAHSGGMVELEGTADTQDVKVASGGEYEAYRLESQHADVRANTGGVAEIHVIQTLDASASTGGMVYYRGRPEILDKDTSLGGEVKMQ